MLLSLFSTFDKNIIISKEIKERINYLIESLQGRQNKSTGRKSILSLSRRRGLYLNSSPIK